MQEVKKNEIKITVEEMLPPIASESSVPEDDVNHDEELFNDDKDIINE